VGLAYSHKFQGIFETAGVADMVLDARRMSRRELVAHCLERFELRKLVRERLAREVPRVRAEVRRCFEELLMAPLTQQKTRQPLAARTLVGM
jgi:polysaccharide pyruvyl transferase WcaK-like protein